MLSKHGYNHYEISNYALKNKECKHNIHYWNLSPYLSFGPSAHSYNLSERWWNYRSLDTYIQNLSNHKSAVEGNEILTNEDNYNEKILNGLRLTEGIKVSSIKPFYNGNYNKYISNIKNKWDCIDIKGDYIKLINNGMLFVDEISSDMFIAS